MRLSILPALFLLGGVIASPVDLASRDTLVIENSIRSIKASLENLAAEVSTLKDARDSAHISMISHHGDELSTQMKNSARDIRAGPNVELREANKLISPIQLLTDQTQRTMTAWINKKDVIINSGGQKPVLRILKQQEIDADDLTKAMADKLPEVSRYIGQQYSQRVHSSFEMAIRAYQPGPANPWGRV